MIIPEQCLRCRHFRRSIFCDAFPDLPGIPGVILDNQADHRQPYPGDNGIRWEPAKPGVKHPLEER